MTKTIDQSVLNIITKLSKINNKGGNQATENELPKGQIHLCDYLSKYNIIDNDYIDEAIESKCILVDNVLVTDKFHILNIKDKNIVSTLF